MNSIKDIFQYKVLEKVLGDGKKYYENIAKVLLLNSELQEKENWTYKKKYGWKNEQLLKG